MRGVPPTHPGTPPLFVWLDLAFCEEGNDTAGGTNGELVRVWDRLGRGKGGGAERNGEIVPESLAPLRGVGWGVCDRRGGG